MTANHSVCECMWIKELSLCFWQCLQCRNPCDSINSHTWTCSLTISILDVLKYLCLCFGAVQQNEATAAANHGWSHTHVVSEIQTAESCVHCVWSRLQSWAKVIYRPSYYTGPKTLMLNSSARQLGWVRRSSRI